MTAFDHWTYSVDREATVRAYARVERGGSGICTCSYCRNFMVAWALAFPADFLALLDRLGIDPRKDAEVYPLGRHSPGRQIYGGWFHFVGSLAHPGTSVRLNDSFTASLCEANAPRLESFKGLDAVQLEFCSESVPWLLNEPEPT